MKNQDVQNKPYISRENIIRNNAPALTLARQHVMNAELHYHDFYELVIVISGSGFHMTNNGEFQITRGNVFLTLPSSIHGCRQGNGLEVVCILFFPDMLAFSLDSLHNTQEFQSFFQTSPRLSDSFRFKNNFMIGAESLDNISDIIRQIEFEQSRRQPNWGFAVNALFMRLLLILLRSISTHESEGNREMLHMNRILQYINANYMKRLYPADLAEEFAVSIRTLERLFKKSLNTSPVTYINDLRLNKSVELLKDSKLSITEVALKSGFSDNCYFSKCFSNKFNISPREYRKANQN